MIAIIDYGLGNVGSVKNMLRYLGFPSVITADPAQIEAAGKLILPGVGAFDNGMRNIRERGLRDVLDRKVLQARTPVLGICLGMQLMFEGSDEGNEPGLGWIGGRVKKFTLQPGAEPVRIPHMGWNTVEVVHDCGLSRGFQEEMRFYFVHSYHAVCADSRDVFLTTMHGGTVVAAVCRGSVMGTQFHPEKSHRYGMTILKNFAELPDA